MYQIAGNCGGKRRNASSLGRAVALHRAAQPITAGASAGRARRACGHRWAALEDEEEDTGGRGVKRQKVKTDGSAADPAAAAPKLRGILAVGGGSGGARKVRWADGEGTEGAGFSIGRASGQQASVANDAHCRPATVPQLLAHTPGQDYMSWMRPSGLIS